MLTKMKRILIMLIPVSPKHSLMSGEMKSPQWSTFSSQVSTYGSSSRETPASARGIKHPRCSWLIQSLKRI